MGIRTAGVAVNYMLPDGYGKNAFFTNRRKQQQRYLLKIHEKFKTPLMLVPLLDKEPEGVKGLLKLGEKIFSGTYRYEEVWLPSYRQASTNNNGIQ